MTVAMLMGVTMLASCGGSTTSKAPSSTAPTTTSSAPTTSTAPCDAKAASVTAGALQLTVDPGTCLRGNQTITVRVTGAVPNSPGGVTECNMAAGVPTVSVQGNQVPVGCTNPLAVFVNTSADKTVSTTFKIITGITGPPASGTDSAGNKAMVDASKYPCPPTPAQIATGDQCTISFGDAGGDQITVPISFAPNTPLTSTKPGSTLLS